MIMKESNKDNFENDVLKSDKVVFVDFWAPWCGPCKMFGPIFEKVSKEYAGKAGFVKVNVDENQELSQQFGVRSIPTLGVFKGGKMVDSRVGALDEGSLKEFVDSKL